MSDPTPHDYIPEDDFSRSREDRERQIRRRRRPDDEDEYQDFDDYPDEPADIGQDAGMRLLLPVGRAGWAIVAGYLGLVSVLCLPGPFALLAGVLAIREMRRDPRKHGMGRAVFGIVMGVLGTIGLLITITALLLSAPKR
jgi:Domain of unknown function (DUF4190)